MKCVWGAIATSTALMCLQALLRGLGACCCVSAVTAIAAEHCNLNKPGQSSPEGS